MSFAQVSPPHERGRDLREPPRSLRLCVILEHAVTLAAPSASSPTAPACRGSSARRDGSAICDDQRRLHLRHLSQVPAPLRSVDYGGLMRDLTPFKINTSKKSCHSRFALSLNDFKSTRINTSTISVSKPPRINTSKKHGERGEGCGPTGFNLHLKFVARTSPRLTRPRRRLTLNRGQA